MKSSLYSIRLYGILITSSVRARMQYKLDFIGSTIVRTIMGMYDFLVVAVVLSRFHTIAGWDIYDIALLFGISRLGWGLYRTFCSELDNFEQYIVTGEFDSILIRPRPVLFTLLSRNLDPGRIMWLLQGAGMLVVAIPVLVARSSISLWPALPVIVGATLCSTMIYTAVGLATAAAAFWIVRIEELSVFTLNATDTASLYPLDIYPNWLKNALLYVLPIAAGNYIPVRYLLNKGGGPESLVLPPLAAVMSLILADLLFKAGQKRYHSTGS